MNLLHRQILDAALIFAASMGLSACAEECPTPVVCPACETCVQPPVTLSQLDTPSRERLKKELMSEVRDELKEELRAELEKEWIAEQKTREANTAETQLAPSDDAAPETQVAAAQPDRPQRIPRHSRPSVPLQSAQPIEKDDRGMKVMRQTFSTSISRRLPVDERDKFTIEDGSIFCFVEISSNFDAERLITIKFTHSTGLTQSYDLPVGQSPAWRTWSKLNLTSSMTGAWLCEVFNEEGVLIASKPFTVE